jgi:hypothetical protein
LVILLTVNLGVFKKKSLFFSLCLSLSVYKMNWEN